MFRFFVDKKQGDFFELSKETLQHIKVARVSNEKFICTFEGKFYICSLIGTMAKIESELNENHEFESEVILAASIIDTKRFEWLVQKAAELGATKLIPMYSQNVSKKMPDIDKKVERWNVIAMNASEQSFRNFPLIVSKPMEFSDVVDLDVQNKFIAHEKSEEEQKTFYPSGSLFLVGPEGGFTNEEVAIAKDKDFHVVSLGKRILRAETASMVLLANIK